MRISISGYDVDARVLDKGEIVSRHTKKPLASVKMEIFFADSDLDAELKQITFGQSTQPINIAIPEYETVELWHVTIKQSITYNGVGSDTHRYQLELIQHEQLHPESLILNNQTIKPYFYEEEYIDDTLQVCFKAEIDPNIIDMSVVTSQKNENITVYRMGICNEPVEMYCHTNIWSKHENLEKHYIRLRECHEEHQPFIGICQPSLCNTIDLTLFVDDLLYNLLETLIEKQIISESDKDSIEDKARNNLDKQRKRIYQVPDVDDWTI